MSEKIAIIMRGVPSSGKSTFARIITTEEEDAIHSTNDYFYKNGEYVFDNSRLREYHNKNYEAFCNSLAKGLTLVVCDNTNHKKWEYQQYVEAAEKYGYKVAYVFMPHIGAELAALISEHEVPEHVIQRMIDNWED